MVIGVLPAYQGQGIGSALVRPVLAEADMEDLPCFVETVQPHNQPLYERHGFRLVYDHVEPPNEGMKLTKPGRMELGSLSPVLGGRGGARAGQSGCGDRRDVPRGSATLAFVL
jgi:hypothetical protein